jgi:hypothetical protein
MLPRVPLVSRTAAARLPQGSSYSTGRSSTAHASPPTLHHFCTDPHIPRDPHRRRSVSGCLPRYPSGRRGGGVDGARRRAEAGTRWPRVRRLPWHHECRHELWRRRRWFPGGLQRLTYSDDVADTGPVQATSTASVTLSPAVSCSLSPRSLDAYARPMQSKLVILKSLASFLRHAISLSTNHEGAARNSDHETISTWYLSSAFSSPQAFDEFDNLLKPSLASSGLSKILTRQRHWEPEATPDTTAEGALGLFPLACSISVDAWSLQDLSDAASSSMNSEDTHTVVTVVSINFRTRLLV